jgi:hypothetical protein
MKFADLGIEQQRLLLFFLMSRDVAINCLGDMAGDRELIRQSLREQAARSSREFSDAQVRALVSSLDGTNDKSSMEEMQCQWIGVDTPKTGTRSQLR